MDYWNRLVVALVAGLVAIAAVVIVLATAGAVDPDFLPGSGNDALFFERFEALSNYNSAAKGASIGISVGIATIMLGVLAMELRTLRRREDVLLPISSTAYVAAEDGSQAQAAGVVNIEASSIRLLAERTGIVNRHVQTLRCRLGVRSRPPIGPASIVISCYPRLEMGSDVQEVGADLRVRIQDAVERLTGLRVIEVNVVRVRYSKNDENRLLNA